jgi:hypothetical protein
MTRKHLISLLEAAQDSLFESNPNLWQQIQDVLQADKASAEWRTTPSGDRVANRFGYSVTVRPFGFEATWHISQMDRAATMDLAQEKALEML